MTVPSPTCTATRHGTASAYRNFGCRCPDALRRLRLQQKTRGRRNFRNEVDVTGSRRRLQALMAIGWDIRTLAPRLGYSEGGLFPVLYLRPRVKLRTAKRIRALYDELSMTPGASTRARNAARRAGYAPPLAWDDETIDDPTAGPLGVFDYKHTGSRAGSSKAATTVDPVAVERALTGERVPLSKAERAEVVHRIVERGQGVARVCQLLPVSNATAQRLVNDARRETRVSSAKVAS